MHRQVAALKMLGSGLVVPICEIGTTRPDSFIVSCCRFEALLVIAEENEDEI